MRKPLRNMNTGREPGSGAESADELGRNPVIAAVILTYRQKRQTLRCLEHLLADQAEGVPFRVLLWDNGSDDDTADAVAREYPSVHVHVSEENLGVAGGRNAGAEQAIRLWQPEFLLFLDNDMVVQSGFVAALWRPFLGESGKRVGQTQAKLRLADDPERLNDGGGCRIQFWLGRTRPVGYGEIDRGQYDTATQCVSCGGAMMVRSQLFEQLGGFDEIFNPFGPEDLDFSLRLQESGWEAWYVPQAMAFHDVSHTFGGGDYTEEYAVHRSRHWLRLMRRHAGVGDWIGFVLVGLPAIAARVIGREARRGNLAALRGLIRGVFGQHK